MIGCHGNALLALTPLIFGIIYPQLLERETNVPFSGKPQRAKRSTGGMGGRVLPDISHRIIAMPAHASRHGAALAAKACCGF
jgi:hypothetical protein